MNRGHRSCRHRSAGLSIISAGSIILHHYLILSSSFQPHQALAFVTPSSYSSPRHSSSSSSSSLHEKNNNSLILASDVVNQQLNEAFSSLNDKDKYETVLTGLCAKIIDGGEKNANKESLMDPLRLLEEMNSSGIIAGPRGVIGLIDVS
jgi:hypothetical protein